MQRSAFMCSRLPRQQLQSMRGNTWPCRSASNDKGLHCQALALHAWSWLIGWGLPVPWAMTGRQPTVRLAHAAKALQPQRHGSFSSKIATLRPLTDVQHSLNILSMQLTMYRTCKRLDLAPCKAHAYPAGRAWQQCRSDCCLRLGGTWAGVPGPAGRHRLQRQDRDGRRGAARVLRAHADHGRSQRHRRLAERAPPVLHCRVA